MKTFHHHSPDSPTSHGSAHACSADFQSAVAPVCNRQEARSLPTPQNISSVPQVANLRYGSLQSCATIGTEPRCSADFQSAVAPVCNRQEARHCLTPRNSSSVPQVVNLRYSSLQSCATIGTGSRRSADCNRQDERSIPTPRNSSGATQVANLRYGRLQICATDARRCSRARLRAWRTTSPSPDLGSCIGSSAHVLRRSESSGRTTPAARRSSRFVPGVCSLPAT